jgi:o-succinylbenzoate synthase
MDLVARAYRIPMRLKFRGITVREGVLLQGPAGWGEFSPFPEYGRPVTNKWFAAARESAVEGWPSPLRDRIPVNVTVPAVAPDVAHSIVSNSGCNTAKVKVGDSGGPARVEAVRDALGPDGNLRVDVNGAWDLDTAVSSIQILDRFDLEYVEQPVASLAEMRALRKRIDVPLAVDETLRTATDIDSLSLSQAADVVVLKVQPLGGVRRALEIAETVALPAVVSSALETSVGIAAGIALAAALPELPYACGLATVKLLDGDVTWNPLVPDSGFISVTRVEPAPDLCGFESEVDPWLARMEGL